jgi:hypothetical protein
MAAARIPGAVQTRDEGLATGMAPAERISSAQTGAAACCRLSEEYAGIPPRAALDLPASVPQEVQHKSNQRHDQEKVNEPTCNAERKSSQQPQYNQNHEDR